MPSKLTMERFLQAIHNHRTIGCAMLITEGFHPKIVYAKADKASRKGYIDCGVTIQHCWLTTKGEERLAAMRDPSLAVTIVAAPSGSTAAMGAR